MYSDFFSQITTTTELKEILAELATVREAIFRTDAKKFTQFLKSKVRGWVGQYLQKVVASEKIDYPILIDQLTEKLHSLEEVELTLAFQPTQSFIETLSDWLEQHLAKKVVLSFTYQPQILGGVIINYQGKYRDFSLKADVEKRFAEVKNTYLDT